MKMGSPAVAVVTDFCMYGLLNSPAHIFISGLSRRHTI